MSIAILNIQVSKEDVRSALFMNGVLLASNETEICGSKVTIEYIEKMAETLVNKTGFDFKVIDYKSFSDCILFDYMQPLMITFLETNDYGTSQTLDYLDMKFTYDDIKFIMNDSILEIRNSLKWYKERNGGTHICM
jgi:hypothetical protein